MANDSSGSVYGIVLLPDSKASEQCIDASTRLGELAPSLVSLNNSNSLAHITVAHVEADLDSAAAMWNVVKDQVRETEAETIGLYLRPSKGMIWVGLDVRITAALLTLQSTVMEICDSQHLPVLNKLGDVYWPHITLGRWTSMPAQQMPIYDMPLGDLGSTNPALAIMGENKVVSEVLSTL